MRCSIIISLMLWAVQSTAQSNLVPNPSFEEFTQCPTNRGQLVYVDYWVKVGGGGAFLIFSMSVVLVAVRCMIMFMVGSSLKLVMPMSVGL